MTELSPGRLHTHKCGYEPQQMFDHNTGQLLPGADELGCGHEFEHHAPMETVPEAEYNRTHLCPKCGRGPWMPVWQSQSLVRWMLLTPSMRVQLLAEMTLRDIMVMALNSGLDS